MVIDVFKILILPFKTLILFQNEKIFHLFVQMAPNTNSESLKCVGFESRQTRNDRSFPFRPDGPETTLTMLVTTSTKQSRKTITRSPFEQY